MSVDISVVMTLHAEGRIAHRTFRALLSAITKAQQKGLSVEVVAVMDRVADSVLKKTVRHWSSIFNGILIVYEVDFGALSLSRNFGVSKSRGEYISIHDGDDLYGEHWLMRAHEVCTSDPRHIAHPEARFSFPIRPFMVLFPQNSFFLLGLIKKNQWSALTMAHRNIFTQIPYIKDDHNFAYQDWLWNCQTAAQGYQHVIVPKTMMAIRQKPPGRSLWQSSFAQYKVVRPNELYKKFFQGEYASLVAEAGESKSQFNIRKMISSFLERHLIRPLESVDTRYFKLYQFVLNFIKDLSRSVKSKLHTKFLPDWLLEELDNLAKIEPTLSGYRAPRILTARPGLEMVRAINRQMARLVSSKSAKVYILDGLDDNAMSVAALLYTRAAKKPVFVITTGKSKNICRDLLPDESSHIDIGNANLNIDEKLLLLHRLLLESNLEFVHVIGSKIALEMLHRHKGSFGRLHIFGTLDHSALVLKKDVIEWQGQTHDQIVDYFTRIATNSSLIHTYLQRVFGLPEELVHFHQLPLPPDRDLSRDCRLNHRRMQRFFADFPLIESEQNPSWETFRRQAEYFYYQRNGPGQIE